MQTSGPFFKPSIAKLELKFIKLDSSLVLPTEERDEQYSNHGLHGLRTSFNDRLSSSSFTVNKLILKYKFKIT